MAHTPSLLLLATLPFQWALPLGNGWDMPLARALAAAIVVTFLFEALIRRKISLTWPQSALLFSFLAWSASSLLWAERLDLAFPKAAFLFNILPLFLVWQQQLAVPEQRSRSVQALLFGAAAAAIVGLSFFFAQFVFGVSETFHFLLDRILPFFLGQELSQAVAQYPSLLVNIHGDTWLRTTAFFPDPHVASYFFGLTFFLALSWAKETGKRRYAAIAALLFLADVLSFSRGGYIGLLFGSISYALLSRELAWSKIQRFFSKWSVLVFVVLFIFGAPVFSRFFTSFTLEDSSSTERIVLWSAAFDTLTQRPFLGTGLGNYLTTAEPLASATTPLYAHNLFFDIALETGLIGATLFFSLFGVALFQLWATRRISPMVSGVFAALTLYLAHSIFETAIFSLHASIVLMFLLGLAANTHQPDLLQSKHGGTD
ncbi:MAG: O-antigen ligase family protein [Undibacterium sp.]